VSSDRELELKYAVSDPAAVRALLERGLAGFTLGPAHQVSVSDRYLDTPEHALARAGYGARLRHAGRHTTLTVKSLASSASPGALHDRLELEGPATRSLVPAHWPRSAARALLEATIGEDRLRALFVIDQQREERALAQPDGTPAAALSLDEARVTHAGRTLGTFWTLEVESRVEGDHGGSQLLETIAAELEHADCLAPELRSKEETALEMVAATDDARIRPPRSPGIRADDDLAEAGRKALRMHLLRMLVLVPDVRAGRNPDAVHRMRVATRRMRAAWRTFDGAYQRAVARRYVAELRIVARALGRVRDLDVQLERLDQYRAALPVDAATDLEPLAKEWQYRRRHARLELLDLLGSAAYYHFVEDYRAFVDSAGTGARRAERRRVRDSAGSRIWAAYEQVTAHDVSLAWADVHALHQLRIDGKRLRYALEFFAEVLPQSAAQLIRDVVALQDHLGLLNDAVLATAITREWLDDASTPPPTRLAAAAYLAATEADIVHLRRGFSPLWRRINGGTFRRRLAAVIGGL
jgi:CHAD domain-containing protein